MLSFIVQLSFSQNLIIHDPQQRYDEAGSLFDPSILRQMDVTFEEDNYHTVLVDAFFNEPSLRIPANVVHGWDFRGQCRGALQRQLHVLPPQRRRKREGALQPGFQPLDLGTRLNGLQQGQIGQCVAGPHLLQGIHGQSNLPEILAYARDQPDRSCTRKGTIHGICM